MMIDWSNSDERESAIAAKGAEAKDRITELEAERDAMKPWAMLGRQFLKGDHYKCADIDGRYVKEAAIALGLLEYDTDWPVQILNFSALAKKMKA